MIRAEIFNIRLRTATAGVRVLGASTPFGRRDRQIGNYVQDEVRQVSLHSIPRSRDGSSRYLAISRILIERITVTVSYVEEIYVVLDSYRSNGRYRR